jgi:hypothetical protein
MKVPRTTTTVSIAGAAALLAILPACGRAGQAGPPAAGPTSSASTTVGGPSQPTTQGQSPAASQPGSVTASPSASGQVLSFRLAYPWHWPNDTAVPGHVTHASAVPPVPELLQIKVGSHPAASGDRAYNRISFTFTNGFPSYQIAFASNLVADGSGKVIPLGGQGVLKIVFTGAQAHTADGAMSSIISQPSSVIGFQRMADYAQAGDFEGVLSYGVGITWPSGHTGQQLPVRAYEQETVVGGQHRYTVAIDIDATNPA